VGSTLRLKTLPNSLGEASKLPKKDSHKNTRKEKEKNVVRTGNISGNTSRKPLYEEIRRTQTIGRGGWGKTQSGQQEAEEEQKRVLVYSGSLRGFGQVYASLIFFCKFQRGLGGGGGRDKGGVGITSKARVRKRERSVALKLYESENQKMG